ncbi:MAG: 1-acyl-sn-glycerol-3-phosphate acyltransferase [Chloroflexota bacterium]
MNSDFQNVPKVHPIVQSIAAFILRMMGWKLIGNVPDKAKFVMIGGPHTSNLDVFLMVMMAWRLGIKLSYLVANDLPFPLNHLSVWSNGIQIDRNHPNSNTVQQVVEYVNSVDKVILMIAPEGRLRKVEYWGSGFYYIALGADLPVVPGYMDYASKTIGIGEPFTPTGDIEADIKPLVEFFAPVTARFPEKASPVRVRPRTKKMQERLADRHINMDNGNMTIEDDQERAAGD